MTTLAVEYASTEITLCACGSAAEPESDYAPQCDVTGCDLPAEEGTAYCEEHPACFCGAICCSDRRHAYNDEDRDR